VFLTGRLTVVGPDGRFDDRDLPGNQARVALAALVYERSPTGRDRLGDILWGEHAPAGWSGSLNALVSKIRSLLDAVGVDSKEVLSSTGGSYQFVAPPGAWVDIEDAVARLDRSEAYMRDETIAAALAEATAASGVLRRPFLSGSDGDWVHNTRQQLAVYLYRCYEVLATGWRIQGDDRLAANIAERAIGLDPYRETGYRLLIEAEVTRGDMAAALVVFDRCETMMQTEFGASPSAATVGAIDGRQTHP